MTPPITVMDFVVGPIEPATKRGFAAVENFVGGLARQFRRRSIQLVDVVLETVLVQRDAVAVEGVGLDDVGAGREIRAVDVEHHVGPRAVEVLVAAFERGSAEIGRREVALLQHGAHGPVEYEDTLLQDVGERLYALLGCGHSGRALTSLAGAPVESA